MDRSAAPKQQNGDSDCSCNTEDKDPMSLETVGRGYREKGCSTSTGVLFQRLLLEDNIGVIYSSTGDPASDPPFASFPGEQNMVVL